MKINNELMNTIASYMDDDIRENLHSELATSNPTESDNENFIREYLRYAPEFSELLQNEFNLVF